MVNETKKNNHSFAELSDTMVGHKVQVICKEDVSYAVYTMEGRSILEGKLKKGKDQIETALLGTGVYMVVLKNNKGETISKKIIKSN